MILLLVMGARYFSYFLTSTEVATSLSDLLLEANLNKYLIMIMVCILYLILGCLMDIWSVMIITLPIFFELLTVQLGFSPLQLGVITVLCIMIGCITPPVGVVVFTLAGMHRDVPMYTIFKGVWPFVWTMCILLIARHLRAGSGDLAAWPYEVAHAGTSRTFDADIRGAPPCAAGPRFHSLDFRRPGRYRDLTSYTNSDT